MTQVCKLCSQSATLQNSHIIPEFVYKPLYDQKNRASRLDLQGGKTRPIQKGLREYLLCRKCEGDLGEIERRIAGVWDIPDTFENRLFEFPQSSYCDLKIFFLSILWRSSVSSLPEFKGVTLGQDGETIRGQLLRQECGPSTQFPIIARLLVSPVQSATYKWLILSPIAASFRGNQSWIFVFGGFAWLFTLGSSRDALSDGALPEIGRWHIPAVNFSSLDSLATLY